MKKAIIIIVALLCCFSSFGEKFKGVYINAFGKTEQEIHEEMVGLGFSKIGTKPCFYEKPGATYGNKLIEKVGFAFEQDKCYAISVIYPKEFQKDDSAFFETLVEFICEKYELTYVDLKKQLNKGVNSELSIYSNHSLALMYYTVNDYDKQRCLAFIDVYQCEKAYEDQKQKAFEDI